MKYLSLFTGIGGFELGIQQAYEDNHCRKQESVRERAVGGDIQRQGNQPDTDSDGQESEKEQGHWLREWVCIGYSEIDKYATSIYQRHFPDHTNYGDITRIDADALPDFDFLCGGFPCQAFSIAGKRKGFDDTRGTLFFDIARILRAKQPRLFLLENVKGLLSHDNGKTFSTIIATLDELGYDLQWQVLNSKNHGVPQNRERVFIVGHLRGTPRPQVFPFGQDGREDSGVSGHIANTLTARYEGAQATGTYIGEGEQHAQVRVPEATKQGYALAGVGDSINLSVPDSKTRRGRVGGGIAQTLDTGMQQHTLTPDMKIRRLTPTECERLQGFPDQWTEGVSDTQRYKVLGNAVSCPVIRDIVSRLIEEVNFIEQEKV